MRDITAEQIDQMIFIRYRKHVDNPHNPSFISLSVIGKIFGIDGSSVRRLILDRFQQLQNERMFTRKKKAIYSQKPIRKRYGIRYIKPEHVEFLTDQQRLNDWGAHTLKHRCVLFHR